MTNKSHLVARRDSDILLRKLEDRVLFSGVPLATIDMPPEEMINEGFGFTINFDNTSGTATDVGYAPYVDLSVPDGINVDPATANFLGAPVDMTLAGEFDASGNLVDIVTGNPVNHPLLGTPVSGGTPGETLYVVELPFGSFVPDQPIAQIDVLATLDKSEGAVVGTPLTMSATGGFALGSDPLDNPGTDAPITGATTTNSITPQVINLTKELSAAEDEISTGPNFPFSYTLTVDIANGETLTDLDLTDLLPNSFVYVGGSVAVDASGATASSGLSITDEPDAGAPQNPTDNDFLIEFDSVTGSTSDSDIVVTYTVWVSDVDADGNPVINAASGDDVLATNDAEVTADYGAVPVGDNDAATDQQISQQSISIQKGVDIANDLGGAEATPGDTLEYTIQVQVSDYFEFSNVVIDDTFSDGQLFDSTFTPTFVINEGGVTTSGAFAAANYSVTHNLGTDGTTDVHFDIFAEVPDGVLTGDLYADAGLSSGTTVSVTFRTVIQEDFTDTFPSGDQSVDTGDVLTNNVTVSGMLPSGQTEADGSGASIEIAGPFVAKSVYAVDADTAKAGDPIIAGHTITYLLSFDMATADFENLVLTDYLPLPIYNSTELITFSTTPTAVPPPAGTVTYGAGHNLHTVAPGTNPPLMTTDAASNSVSFDFGDFDVSPSVPARIELLITVTAQDLNFADGLFLTNQANASYGSTFNSTITSNAIAQNQVAAPDLRLTKGIVSTDAVSPTFDAAVGPVGFEPPNSALPAFGGGINSTNLSATPIDANLTGADAGDLVKFAIVIENTGGAEGLNLLIQDVIPPEYLVPGSGLNLEVRDGGGNLLAYVGADTDLFGAGIDIVDPGMYDGAINNFDDAQAAGDGSNIIVITYDLELATAVSSNSTYNNTAEIAEFGTVDGGADHTAGTSNSNWTDDADVTTRGFAPVKSIVATSEVHTGMVGGFERVTIGEIVRYRLAVEIPEATLTNLQIQDLLPAGLQFVDDGTAMVAFISNGAGITSSDIPGTLNLAVPAGANVSGNSVVAPTFVLGDQHVGSDSSVDLDPDTYANGSDPRFKLGTIVNADNDADSEYLVIEFNALILNAAAAGNDQGDQRDNSFSVNVDGTAEDASNTSRIIIAEPLINNLDKTVAPASGDVGDVVTYTITFSNANDPTRSTAFDVNLLDDVPSDLTLDLASIGVVLGGGATGVTDNSAGNLLDLTIDEIPVGGTVTVTFDATLNATVPPGETLLNDARLTYTGLPGGGTAVNPTGSSTGGVSGADDGERDGSGGHNDYGDADTASLLINAPTITKTLLNTSIDNGNNALNEAVIGELVTYQIAVDIPETTIPGSKILDTLDLGLEFISLDSVEVFSAGTPTADVTSSIGAFATTALFNPAVTGDGSATAQDLEFDFGTLVNVNGDNTQTETLVITYTARVVNTATNQNDAGPGTMLNNVAQFEWAGTSGTLTSAPNSAAPLEVLEAELEVVKAVDAATGDAGDTITYTVVVQHSADSDTDAFDITFTDTIPAEVNVAFPGDFTIVHSTLGNVSALFELTASNELRTVAGASFDLDFGETLTVTVVGTLDISVEPGEMLNNTACVDWTSLDGVNAAERTGDDGVGGALDDYAVCSNTVTTTINSPTLGKELIATSIVDPVNANDEAVIGETIQYRVTVVLPEGTTNAAQIIDDLDLGLEFISFDSLQVLSGGVPTADVTSSVDLLTNMASFTPTVTGDGSTVAQQLTFDFGTLVNNNTDNAAAEAIVLTYTVRVMNVPGNTSNGGGLGTLLDNAAFFEFTRGVTTVQTSIDSAPPVEVIEPELDITKTISDDTPYLGQTVTYTLTISHTAGSDADAQDLRVTDLVPAGLTLDLATLNVVGATVITDSSAGSSIDLVLDQLALGNTITITYDATVSSDVADIGNNLNNTANTSWSSLPDGVTAGAGPERDGDAGNGGEDDYADNVSETAVITHPLVELTKTLVGSPVAASSGISDNVDVTFDFTIFSTGNDPLTQMSLVEDLAAQYGGAFVGLVGSPAIVSSTATDQPELNAAYDGGFTDAELFDNSGANTNSLAGGEFVTIRITLEIDPDAVTAILTSGNLVNQATVTGTGDDTGVVVTDQSDDPSNPADVDPNGDNNPDDPNLLRFPDISLTKEIISGPSPAASGMNGNYDVTFEFAIENVGTTSLDSITLVENLQSQFGGAFVGLLGLPTITASTATDDPGLNLLYDGTAGNANIFDGSSSQLNPNETITVQVSIEFDPDHPTAILDGVTGDGSGDFENQATTSGIDTVGGGTLVNDDSDDPVDATNVDPDGDNNPDDPTTMIIPDINLEKAQVGAIVPAASGIAGNFEVTYDFTISNIGGEGLGSLSLVEDLQLQYGGAFAGIVGSPTIIASTATDAIELNTAYDGTTANPELIDNSGGNTNLLDPGQTITVRLVIEIDPDSPTGIITGGTLVNQATTSGTGDVSGNTVNDDSDDPNNLTDSDPNLDNDPDDPNAIRIPWISLEKSIVGAPSPAASGMQGNYDVTYQFTIENDGTTPLEMITLVEDLQSHLGGAFVNLISSPVITASTATDDPGINPLYDGTAANSNIFDGSTSLLNLNESVTVQLIIEVDPDNATAVYDSVSGDGNNDLENQAATSGQDPFDGTLVTDNSDDPADATNTDDDADNDPDDPTTLLIPEIALIKTLIGSPVPATSGTAGNYELTYDLQFTNIGNEALNSLSLLEDLQTQYGGAFVQIVGSPAITASTASDAIELNAAYDGTTANAELVDNSGLNTNLLDIGESVTVRIVIEVDPDDPAANIISGGLVNQAIVAGTGDQSATTVNDESDNPADATNTDPDSDNNPDDPNTIRIPLISLEKSIVGAPIPATSGMQGNYDVTYQFTIENNGTTPLEMITLVEDLQTQFGGAFVGLVGAPAITASTATDDPGLNPLYDGTPANSSMFDGSTSLLNVNESVTVQIVIEVDPDNPTAVYDSVTADGNNDLENQAATSGQDPADGTLVTDNSDDPADATNNDDDGDGEPDDPTAIILPEITLVKTLVGAPLPASSGISGNVDVTYDFTFTNTGNEALNSLSLLEDLGAQYGGAFVGLVAPAAVTASTASDPIELNAAYDGTTANSQLIDNSVGNTNLLDIGESVTVRLFIEVNPDDPAANLLGGGLFNQATVAGTGTQTSTVVNDDSDDATDPTNNDPNSDNNPDDPNEIRISTIELTKDITSAVAASSGIFGNHDVTYQFVVTNTGTTDLNNLVLTDDWASQFGGAFIQIIPGSLSVTDVNATVVPGANPAYTGGTAQNMLDGTGLLQSGESFIVELTVEIDPNAAGAIQVFGAIQNQAQITGEDPVNPGVTAQDDSDDTSNATDSDPNGDNNPDDPTRFVISDIGAAKRIVSTVPSSTLPGVFVATYEFVIRNVGGTDLTNITMADDMQSSLGPAFLGINSAPVIVGSTATTDPNLNPLFDGNTGGVGNSQVFDGTSGLLQPGEEIIVQIDVFIEADQLMPGSNNQATVGGFDGTGAVSDLSDTGGDPEGNNIGVAGDSGGEDDPTLPPGIGLAKNHGTPIQIGNDWMVPVTFVVENLGLTDLVNLNLIEDIASQFGPAFLSATLPVIDATGVVGGTAPGVNATWTGDTTQNMLDGTGLLTPGDTFTITFDVTINPDASGTSSVLDNQGEITATDPSNPAVVVRDYSDSGLQPNGNNPGEPGDTTGTEDPTPLQIPDIGLSKFLSDTAINGANFDVTYHLVIENTGTVDLINISLFDDLESQFLPHELLDAENPAIVSSSATANPMINTGWSGDVTANMFDGVSGIIKPGESIVVEVTVTVKPDFNELVNGKLILVNQAQVSGQGLDENGNPLLDDAGNPMPLAEDDSDSGADANGSNPGQPGDSGSLDDPTPVELPVFAFDSFRNESEVEQYHGFRDDIDHVHPPFPIDTMYTGITEPGTTLKLKIFDKKGFEIGERIVVADTAGNWLATFHGTIVGKNPHTMLVTQTPPIYQGFDDTGFNLRRYFHPAVHHSLFFHEPVTVQSVARSLPHTVLSSMHEANRNPMGFGWTAHAYELVSSSTNASYQ